MFEEFCKAIPEPRGCGIREEGGVYAECGVGPGGTPIEQLLFDPPLPLPEGIDIINKPHLWPRTDPATGEPVLDLFTEEPIYDLLIWVGAEHYPHVPDYVEETRRLGASRRLNPQMDFSKITWRSRMLLAHPRAIIASWRELFPPEHCDKQLPNHDKAFYDALSAPECWPQGQEAERDACYEQGRVGPCIFKLWEVLPEDDASETFPREGERPVCLRRIGSTTYTYRPTGEEVTAWGAGFFLGLPITSIALIQYEDGSVNERAKATLLAGVERNKHRAIPFYETDC